MRLDFYGQNALAYNSRDPEILLAGAAGTGKSVVLLAKCLTLLGKYHGTRGLFARGTRHSLTQSGLVTFERDVLGPNHPVLTKSPVKRRVRQSYEFSNGSEFVVCGLDDPGKALSSDYDFMYIQEATEEGYSLETHETLIGRLRSGVTPFRQLMMDCNPTTPSHFLYKRFQKGLLKKFDSLHKDNPRFWDRVKGDWTPSGREYVEGTLKRMTGYRLDRFYRGVWRAAEGVVYDGFDPRPVPDGHLLPAGWKPPRDWPRIWSIDWGFTSPLVLQFWAVDGDGRAYLYREVYRVGVRAATIADWAKREVEAGRESMPRAAVCDHDETMKKEFEAAGPPRLRLELADKKDLVAGIQVMQGRFDRAGDGRPRIFFVEDALAHPPDTTLSDAGRPCNTVEELGAYIWDPNSLKDMPLDKDNHGCDAGRYSIRKIDKLFSHARSSKGYGGNPNASPHGDLSPDVWR